MKKYVTISSNSNDNYIFYLPLVVWCWNKLDWGVVVLETEDCFLNKKWHYAQSQCPTKKISLIIPSVDDYKTETLAQVGRLYPASMLQDDVLLMTSDIDMIPLSDYWKPGYNDITCYGRDLSNEHQPICYISSNVKSWKGIMNITGNSYKDMKRDLDNEKSVVWVTDQDIITDRLSKYKVVIVDRGVNPFTGYPIGRIDRSNWDKSLQYPERIDAHLFREGWKDYNWAKIISLIIECFNPTIEEINWMEDYRNEYVKLVNQ